MPRSTQPAAAGPSDAAGPGEPQSELERLQRENDDLRNRLALAGDPVANRPRRPSFGMAEGTREELERTGRAVDPFTGDVYVKTADGHQIMTPAAYAEHQKSQAKAKVGG